MSEEPIDNLDDYTIEVSRLNDELLRPGDRILYSEPYPGRVMIARAPIRVW